MPPSKSAFQGTLLSWYAFHKRDLPWRKTKSPYKVLVSEMMLQQTQVERVLPKYREWLRKYPSFKALAAAPLSTVKKTWYPLGYNIRPIRLHSIARETVAKYGGRLPRTEEALLSLKGIGRYTAGAVRSFAFGHDAPILDTNVKRVLTRVFYAEVKNRQGHGRRGGGRPLRGAEQARRRRASPCGQVPHRTNAPNDRLRPDPGGSKAGPTIKDLWALSESLLPGNGRTYDFNSALMDFGATVCTAKRPKCPSCIFRRSCEEYGQRRVGQTKLKP